VSRSQGTTSLAAAGSPIHTVTMPLSDAQEPEASRVFAVMFRQ
jgi:hypothetical protein